MNSRELLSDFQQALAQFRDALRVPAENDFEKLPLYADELQTLANTLNQRFSQDNEP